jgi:hypothetical protein
MASVSSSAGGHGQGQQGQQRSGSEYTMSQLQASASDKDNFFNRKIAENDRRPEGLPPSQGAWRRQGRAGRRGCCCCCERKVLRAALLLRAADKLRNSSAPLLPPAGGKYVGFGSAPAPRPGGSLGGGGGSGGGGGGGMVNVDEVSQVGAAAARCCCSLLLLPAAPRCSPSPPCAAPKLGQMPCMPARLLPCCLAHQPRSSASLMLSCTTPSPAFLLLPSSPSADVLQGPQLAGQPSRVGCPRSQGARRAGAPGPGGCPGGREGQGGWHQGLVAAEERLCHRGRRGGAGRSTGGARGRRPAVACCACHWLGGWHRSGVAGRVCKSSRNAH